MKGSELFAFLFLEVIQQNWLTNVRKHLSDKSFNFYFGIDHAGTATSAGILRLLIPRVLC